MAPRLSIILTTYNRAPLLAQALQSIADQTFTDYECLVIDDGSTDNTHQLLENWPHPLRLIKHAHTGRPEPLRNAGMSTARGKYIAFLDDDDQWRPDYLAQQTAILEESPAFGLAYCDLCFRDSAGNLSSPRLDSNHKDGSRLLDYLLDGWAIYPSITIFRRSLLEQTGLIDETISTQGDYDFLLRLAYNTTAVCNPEPLVILSRYHDGLAKSRERLHYENAIKILLDFASDHSLSRRQQLLVRRTTSRRHNHLAQLDLADNRPISAASHYRRSISLYPLQRKAWLGLLQTIWRNRK